MPSPYDSIADLLNPADPQSVKVAADALDEVGLHVLAAHFRTNGHENFHPKLFIGFWKNHLTDPYWPIKIWREDHLLTVRGWEDLMSHHVHQWGEYRADIHGQRCLTCKCILTREGTVWRP